jgi:cell division protein FtsB
VTALSVLAAVSDSTVSWDIGYAIGVIVVLVVVALVVPILVLAHRIGNQAAAIDDALTDAVENTSALAELTTTNDAATRIVAGLERGRTRLGG